MNSKEQHFYADEVMLHFNLRSPKSDNPTPIYAVVRIGKQQIKIPTNVRVYPFHWDKKKEQALVSASIGHADNENNCIVNRKLSSIRLGFSEFLRYIVDRDVAESDFVSILIKMLNISNMKTKSRNALLDLGRLIEEQNMTDGSKRQYRATLKSFKQFVKEKHGKQSLGWHEFSLALITDYRVWFSNRIEVHKITKETVQIEDNTVAAKMNLLYTILTYAERKDLIDLQKTKICKIKNIRFKRTKSEDNQIYLSEEDINRLLNLQLEGIEQQVRDLFLFQLELGQRYSDINGFAIEKPSRDIVIIQKKSGERIDIKLTDTAFRIFSKYEFQFPTIPNQKCNKLLKEIAKKANLTSMQEICEIRGGKQYRYNAETWRLIGTHTARRSFISNCLLKGIGSDILMKQTGHRTNSAFTRYNRIGSKEASIFIAQVKDGSQQTAPFQPNTSFMQDFKNEVSRNIALETENRQNKQKIKSLQQVVTIEQSFAEDEKNRRLTIEEAYRQGIPYELFMQIQKEQDEIADLAELADIE